MSSHKQQPLGFALGPPKPSAGVAPVTAGGDPDLGPGGVPSPSGCWLLMISWPNVPAHHSSATCLATL